MQGYLNKKSDKNNKWKSMYFVLQSDGADVHLYFYDNPKVCVGFPDKAGNVKQSENVNIAVDFLNLYLG